MDIEPVDKGKEKRLH